MNTIFRFLMVGMLVSVTTITWGMDKGEVGQKDKTDYCGKILEATQAVVCYPGYVLLNTSLQDIWNFNLNRNIIQRIPFVHKAFEDSWELRYRNWYYAPVTAVMVAAIIYGATHKKVQEKVKELVGRTQKRSVINA